MSFIDIVAKIAPGYAARRVAAQLSYKVNQKNYATAKRLYDAATVDQYRRPINGSGNSANATMAAAGTRLRDLSRHLEENHDLTVAIFDDLLNNVVGAGANVSPMIRKRDGSLAEDMNKRVFELFLEWGQSPETTGEMGFEQMERQVARHLFRDGEIFLRPIMGSKRFAYKTKVPYAVDMLEADYCPMELQSADGNIIQGVECNQWGAPKSYQFYKNHPGELIVSPAQIMSQTKRVKANYVYHLKFSRRIRQRRGVPLIHAVINRMQDIKEYEESERIAAKIAADFTFAITKKSETGLPTDVNDANNRNMQMSAGMGFELLPGEDVKTIASDRPNTGLNDFRNAMLKAVAGGTGTRFSAIAREYGGTYSSQRQELVEGAVAYRVHFNYMVRRFYSLIWADFVNAAMLSGQLGSMMGIDIATLTRCDFRAPALPWIDPKKEADAWKTLIESKLESRTEIQRQRGRDPRKIREELEQEQKEEVYSSHIDQVETEATGILDDDDSEAAA